jgi:hypothetical protein
MNVKERIKKFAKYSKITISAFEKSILVTNGYVNSISKSIGIDKIELILERYPNLNIEWLLAGRGEMLKEDIKEVSPVDNEQQNIEISKLKEYYEARLRDKEEIIEGLKFKIATFEKDEKATMSEQEIKDIKSIIKDRKSSVPRGAVEAPDRPNGPKLGEEIGK